MVLLKLSRVRSRRNLFQKREPKVQLLRFCRWQLLKEGSQSRLATFDLIGQAEPLGSIRLFQTVL